MSRRLYTALLHLTLLGGLLPLGAPAVLHAHTLAPVAGTLTGALQSGCGEGYTVQAGDTLTSIAQRCNTTVDALMRANRLTSANIFTGQSLIIPGPGYFDPPTIHIVQRGDTLTAIAQRYGTTIPALVQINNLVTTTLYVGQRLQIAPSDTGGPPSATVHTVQRGETLSRIAQRYGVTVQAMLQANQLTSSTIYVGQRLTIPAPGGPQPPPSSDGTVIHVVGRGDTLSAIAQRYGATVRAIIDTNRLQTTTIYVGQRLIVPVGVQTSGRPTLVVTPVQRGGGPVIQIVARGLPPRLPVVIAMGPVASEFSDIGRATADDQGRLITQLSAQGFPSGPLVLGLFSDNFQVVSEPFSVIP